MIQQTFFAACEDQISHVTATIAEEQGALGAEEDRERAELMRVRIKSLEKLLEVVKNFRTETLCASAAVGEMEARHIRWRARCAEARVAQDEMEQLAKQVESTRLACIAPQNDAAVAEAELDRQRRMPLPQYASEPEIHRANKAVEKLQGKYDAALARLREVVRTRDETHKLWFGAAKKFEKAVFDERMARLPTEPPAYKSPGELRQVA